jgi:hypothetical protein
MCAPPFSRRLLHRLRDITGISVSGKDNSTIDIQILLRFYINIALSRMMNEKARCYDARSIIIIIIIIIIITSFYFVCIILLFLQFTLTR